MIGLGTVQFGLAYGISSRRGKVPETEVKTLLLEAMRSGIGLLDTAALYGDSESVLGRTIPNGSTFRIVTKTPVVNETKVTIQHAKEFEATFNRSLDRLRRTSIDSLLVHHGQNLLLPGGERLVETLQILKDKGHVRKIGVSVYTALEIDGILNCFTPDIVQLPINLADQRLISSGHLAELKAKGVEIHARSLFMQGLLLMSPEEVSPYFDPIRNHLREIHEEVAEHALSPLEACLQFGLAQPELDVLLIGVAATRELGEIVSAVGLASARQPLDFKPLALENEKFLNPENWRLPG